MQLSAEIRWFWQKELPHGLKGWFCGTEAHQCKAGGGESRQDEYLSDINQVELGIKNRGGKKGVEVKGLVAVLDNDLTDAPFGGSIEIWSRWTSESLILPANSTITTRKRRWMRKLDTRGTTPEEVALGAYEKPIGREWPPRGCNIEITEVTLLDKEEVWWTLGFESFGNLSTVDDDLRAAAKEFASRNPPDFEEGMLASYPAWLASRSKGL